MCEYLSHHRRLRIQGANYCSSDAVVALTAVAAGKIADGSDQGLQLGRDAVNE